jgi:methylglutaconyl-CoA hydratase
MPGLYVAIKLPPVSALQVERHGLVLRVTLARPEKRNAFEPGLIGELTEAFADVGDARAVLLAGEGRSFSAGADAEWMRASIGLTHEENVAEALRLRHMLLAVDACPAPVVAPVQGHALGGGLGLVACADIAVAAEDTVFGFTETRLGLIPAAISPFVLGKIGPSAARRYFLTGERFDAYEALRIGLVHEVADDLDATCERILEELRSAGPEAARAAKQLVLDAPLGDETASRIAQVRAGAEAQEGLTAFLEKRPPAWQSGSSS